METRHRNKICKVMGKKKLPDENNSSINQPALQTVIQHYRFEAGQENSVKDYLAKNNDLIPVLIEALPQIQKHFGKAPLSLEIMQDPEENFDELFVNIKTSIGPDEALSLEDKFGRDWFVLKHSGLIGRLNFNAALVHQGV